MTERAPNNTNRPNVHTEWDSLASESKLSRPENRQRRKLISYYLSGGDVEEVIFRRDAKEVNEEDEAAALDMIRNRKIPEDYQHRLLEAIDGPLTPNSQVQRGNQIQHVLDHIDTPFKNEILEYVTGFDPRRSHKVNLSDVDWFIRNYPTPIEFEALENRFMRRFDTSTPQGRELFQNYSRSMQAFKHDIYGKKQEYYDQMKQLKQDAEAEETRTAEDRYAEQYAKQQNTSPGEIVPERQSFRRLGSKALDALATLAKIQPSRAEQSAERYRLVKDAGSFSLNKGELIGKPDRRNEDSSFFAPHKGLFGVFDGMGGHNDGAIASETAVRELSSFANNHSIRNKEDFEDVMRQMSDAVRRNTREGGTTAAIGQVIEGGGRKKLLYTWAGDSRIYLIRDGRAFQLTQDEGFGRVVTNFLGIPSEAERTARTGECELKEGDYLLFCSDGITGDVEKDFIPKDEITRIVEQSDSAKAAAANLAKRATKIDDRTAIVVRI